MGEVELMQMVGNVGFPIAVAAYCLVTLNKTVNSLKDTITNNTVVMQRILDKIEGN
jgi:hypothetical protein